MKIALRVEEFKGQDQARISGQPLSGRHARGHDRHYPPRAGPDGRGERKPFPQPPARSRRHPLAVRQALWVFIRSGAKLVRCNFSFPGPDRMDNLLKFTFKSQPSTWPPCTPIIVTGNNFGLGGLRSGSRQLDPVMGDLWTARYVRPRPVLGVAGGQHQQSASAQSLQQIRLRRCHTGQPG